MIHLTNMLRNEARVLLNQQKPDVALEQVHQLGKNQLILRRVHHHQLRSRHRLHRLPKQPVLRQRRVHAHHVSRLLRLRCQQQPLLLSTHHATATHARAVVGSRVKCRVSAEREERGVDASVGEDRAGIVYSSRRCRSLTEGALGAEKHGDETQIGGNFVS